VSLPRGKKQKKKKQVSFQPEPIDSPTSPTFAADGTLDAIESLVQQIAQYKPILQHIRVQLDSITV